MADDETEGMGGNFKALPNNFPGNEFGRTNVIRTFRNDINRGQASVRRWNNFVLTIHTTKRSLWSLESPAGMLVGVGNCLAEESYLQYIRTLPLEVHDMMKEEFEKFRFPDCNALMFAVNNTFRVLPSGIAGMYQIYFPDNSWLEVSGNIYDVMPADLLVKNDNYWGYKISRWVRLQLSRYKKSQ